MTVSLTLQLVILVIASGGIVVAGMSYWKIRRVSRTTANGEVKQLKRIEDHVAVSRKILEKHFQPKKPRRKSKMRISH